MRREQVDGNGGCLKEEGDAGLLDEKVDYLYRNYSNGTEGSVIFTGCSFPSYFPETTKLLAALFKETAGIGIVFDCYGKPVAELGFREDAERIVRRIDKKLAKLHIDEVIMAEEEGICTYCASCSGKITRKGYGEAGYLLSEILGSRERQDVLHAIENRRNAKDWHMSER